MSAQESQKAVSSNDQEAESRVDPDFKAPEVHHNYFPTPKAFLGWVLTLLLGFLGILAAFTAHHLLYPGLAVGDIADRDIKAKHSAFVRDEEETRKAENRARHSIMPIFKEDKSQYQAFRADVRQLLDTIAELQKLGVTPSPSSLAPEDHLIALDRKAKSKEAVIQVSELKPKDKAILQAQIKILQAFRQSHPELVSDQVGIAVSVQPADFGDFADKTIAASEKMCRVMKRFPVDDNSFWHETVIEFLPDEMPLALKNKVGHMLCTALKPNFVIDEDATREKGDQVVSSVKPHTKEIKPGEVVLRKGSQVNDDNYIVLGEVGALNGINWPLIFSLALSLAAGSGLIALFLYTYEAKILFSTSSLGLIFTVCILTAGVATAIGKIYPQFVPLPMAALVLTIFFGRRTAFVICFPLLILLAVDRVIDLNNLLALGTASGAAIGTYSKQRHDLVFTGLIVGMMQALGFIASLAAIQMNLGMPALGKSVSLEFFGGVTSAMFAIGMLPFLENMFGLLTPFRLSELVNADQPLLRKLEEEAPGTYQHSLAVANLAEAGAHAINADACLVRAGALYHDVGKMVRPKYFIENQLGDKNPHDALTPEESRERVLAHVTDGLALAKKYAVPKAVQDFIPMHQGTCLMAYFFHKACVRDGSENVDARFYRYPGPKPQSKETAVVMLADVSEAVTHSMTDPTQEEVESSISKVFENRWQDGQFSESSLSHAELMKIKGAFLRVWRTLHHERIKYPSTTTGRMPIPPENLPKAPAVPKT